MKSSISILFLLISISLSFAGTQADIVQINIGDKLPAAELKVKDVSGDKISLDQSVDKNGLLVIFSCNTCPYVIGWEGRYPELKELCNQNGLGMVVLNSNEAKRKKEDSFEEMVAHAKDRNYNFPYAVDTKHKIADAFGATKTPDVFLFNSDLNLVYKGAIDDNMKEPESVMEPFLKNAITSLIAGSDINPNVTKAIGCSIKRVE